MEITLCNKNEIIFRGVAPILRKPKAPFHNPDWLMSLSVASRGVSTVDTNLCGVKLCATEAFCVRNGVIGSLRIR